MVSDFVFLMGFLFVFMCVPCVLLKPGLFICLICLLVCFLKRKRKKGHEVGWIGSGQGIWEELEGKM